MKFTIRKELLGGRYFVTVNVNDFQEQEIEKAKKFGWPSLTIKRDNGKDIMVKITSLSDFLPYGFYDHEEAYEYSKILKNQILILKENFSRLTDTWSDEETL